MIDKVLKGSETHIHQVGVVVKDLDKTIAFLSAIGLGPFTIRNSKHAAATVRGKKESYEVRIALAQQGSVQLELIEYINGETIHGEFLKDKGEGLHHIRFMVSDLDAVINKFSEIGVNVLQEDRFVDGGGIAYMETNKMGGFITEVTQVPPGFTHEKGAEYKS
ncbi:VOC family protein [Thermodesulfobacteriota bacterium]